MPGNRVLLIHNNYGPGGGAETHFQLLVKALRERGYDIYTFSLSANIVGLISERDFVYWEKGHPRIWKLWRYVFHLGIFLRLKRILRKIQPDWVHLHVIEQPFSILPALRNQIVIHTIHTSGPVCLTTFLTRRDDLQPCEGGIGLKCLYHRCVSPFVFLPNSFLTGISNRLMKRYIQSYMTPSEFLQTCLQQQGFTNIRSVPLFVRELDSGK